MNEPIGFKESNCQNCYKCIRHCPVKSISFSHHMAHVIPEECILCGKCVEVCPQHAKTIRNDIDIVKTALESGKNIIVSLAPSFSANYPGVSFSEMKKALLKLGFKDVEETATAATWVKNRYDQILLEDSPSLLISSCCPSVNLLIEQYYPELTGFLAPVLPPASAHAKRIKQVDETLEVAFIGPCISKKKESDEYPGILDYALTYQELTEWLMDQNVILESSFLEESLFRAQMFPLSGGIIDSMWKQASEYEYIAVDGVEDCLETLQELKEHPANKVFLEMSLCRGGCVGGPGMDAAPRRPILSKHAIRNKRGLEDQVGQAFGDIEYDIASWRKPIRHELPSETMIQSLLKKMDKHKKEDELNCGSCGYSSCREKAIALYQGKAEITMCLPYLKEQAESLSKDIIENTPNGIMVLSEEGEIKLLNPSACRILRVPSAKELIGKNATAVWDVEGINPLSGKVQTRRRYVSEYEIYVEETAVKDEKIKSTILILRDVTEEERQRQQKDLVGKKTLDLADRIIEKQMKTVQEIASLLGESSAEVKIAITKIKEAIVHE